MLYLYAFVRPDASVPDEPGIEGRPPVLVPLRRVAAVVADVDGKVEPTDDHVLTHARVVDAVAAANDAVLPVRFGRGFRSVEELEASVERIVDELEEGLDRVSGCVEIGLQVVGREKPTARVFSGRDYMQRRMREIAHADAVAEAIHAPLAERARAATQTRGAAQQPLLRASYLVARDDVDGFRASVDDVRRRHADLTFACTGPWPPYSFASLDDEGEE